MNHTSNLITQNKQILTQLIALTKREDTDILDQIEPLLQQATESIKQLTALSADELSPFKEDYISMMALLDQLILILQTSQDETRVNAARVMQQIKAQKGYTK